MPAFSTFVRRLPPDLVHRYLASLNPALVSEVDCNAERSAFARLLVQRHREWSPDTRERIDSDSGRIWKLIDEAGQAALYGIWGRRRAELDVLESGPARAMYAFQVDLGKFRLAESARF